MPHLSAKIRHDFGCVLVLCSDFLRFFRLRLSPDAPPWFPHDATNFFWIDSESLFVCASATVSVSATAAHVDLHVLNHFPRQYAENLLSSVCTRREASLVYEREMYRPYRYGCCDPGYMSRKFETLNCSAHVSGVCMWGFVDCAVCACGLASPERVPYVFYAILSIQVVFSIYSRHGSRVSVDVIRYEWLKYMLH